MCSIVWDKSMGISKKRLPTNYEQKVPGSYVLTHYYWPIPNALKRNMEKPWETVHVCSCHFTSLQRFHTIPVPRMVDPLEVVRSAALADLWPGSSPSSFYSFAFRFKTWPIKINGLHSNAFKCHKWIQQEESSVIGIELMALSWSVTAHSRKVSVDWTRPHEMSAGHGESYKVSNTGQVPS